MKRVRVLWRREVREWLTMPSFHLMGIAYLLVTGIAFWMFAVTMGGRGLLTTEITFSGMTFWMAFLVTASAISTRLLGDELERGTLELLLTAPLGEVELVVAKWAAGVYLVLLLALSSAVYPWLLRLVYPEWHELDPATWLAGVLLLVLASTFMVLAGLFWSLVIRRQTPALVATFLTGMLLVFRGSWRSWIGGTTPDGSTGFVAVASHVASFAAGLVDSRTLVFYATVAGVLFFATVRLLQWLRFRRLAGTVNVVVTLVLAGILVALLNYLAWLHPLRWDAGLLGESPLGGLAKTLDGVKTPARLTLLAPLGEPAADAARRVVEKYRHIHPALEVRVVDEGSEVVRTRELAQQYRIHEPAVVIVSCGERFRILSLQDLQHPQEGRERPGPQAVSFASGLDNALLAGLQAVTRDRPPVVYFLSGHGERGVADYTDFKGYSEIGALLNGHHALVRTLVLGSGEAITNDCALLVVAGPARSLAAWERARIRDYVGQGGRVMMLLDSGVETGLEPLLEEWGVRLGQDRVVDARVTSLLPGSRERAAMLGLGEVPIVRYARHPVCDSLDGLVTTFVMPRSVEVGTGQASHGSLSDHVDKPLVTALAFSAAESWADLDLTGNPPQFNEGYDRRGPISLAVAVEKGVSSEIAVDIKPVRMVVFGDSQFAANRCLAGGNEHLFVNAVRWLLDSPMPDLASPGQQGLYTLKIDQRGRWLTFLLVVLAMPLILVLRLVWVSITRRDRRSVAGSSESGAGGAP